MSLTKEECLKAHYELSNILVETDYIDGRAFCTYPIMEDELGTMYQLIEEHFELIENFKQLEKNYDDLYDEVRNNPPLKFEELCEGMWVWDKDFNRFGEWLKILIVKINDYDEKIIKALCVGTNEIMIRSYKKDRFYRNQVD